jgi:hypothetical protein
MKKLSILTLVLALALSAFAGNNTNSINTDEWRVSLAGSGGTITKGNSASFFGAQASIGRTGRLILPVEAGIRQGISYADGTTVGNTAAYADWTVLTAGNFELQLGASAGAAYGNIALTWEAAPEVVGKVYLKSDVWVFGRVAYPIELTTLSADNALTYVLGIGVSFK